MKFRKLNGSKWLISLCTCPRSRTSLRYASTFFPNDPSTSSRPSISPLPSNLKPKSPYWFTGRPTYNEAITQIQTLTHHIRQNLYNMGILASYSMNPVRALETLGIPITNEITKRNLKWIDQEQMSSKLLMKVRLTQYRQITSLLQELSNLLPHAYLADRIIAESPEFSDAKEPLAGRIIDILKPYLSAEAFTVQFKPRVYAKVDHYGRAYAVGRRKTASAQVWMIRVRDPNSPSLPSQSDSPPDATLDAPPSSTLDPKTTPPAPTSDKSTELTSQPLPMSTDPTIAQILINRHSLADHLVKPYDRSLVLRPFTVTKTLGAYNVYALTRGGGTTGQATAVQLGIAKCLVVLEGSEAKSTLSKARLLTRDPRMVWRKLPGRVKSRKAHQWGKR